MRPNTKVIRGSAELDAVLRDLTNNFGFSKKQASDFVAVNFKKMMEEKKMKKDEIKIFKFW